MRHRASHHPPTWPQSSPNNAWVPRRWVWEGKDISNVTKASWKQEKAPCWCLRQGPGKFSLYLCWWQPATSRIPCLLGKSRTRGGGHQVCCWSWALGWAAQGITGENHFCSQFIFRKEHKFREPLFVLILPRVPPVQAASLLWWNQGKNEELACFPGAGQSSAESLLPCFRTCHVAGHLSLAVPRKEQLSSLLPSLLHPLPELAAH